jgi:ATP-binding cassette subfamily F protein 3
MSQILVSGAGVEFGSTTVFENVTFTVGARDRWGIVGRNGTGKTTLFNLLTGSLAPSRGSIARQPGLRLTLLEQYRDFGKATTVWEAAALPFSGLFELERSLADQATALAEHGERVTSKMLERYDRDLERFAREGGYDCAARVDAVLHGLGFDPEEARSRPIEQLSGGERGRVGLACQLVSPADVLLLDEPTNHLDLETTRWLEQYLQESDRTILVISHDRAFLANVVDHVLHFDGPSVIPYAGGYESFVAQRQERRLAEQRAFDKQQRVIANEMDYIRRNIAGQNSKQAKGRRRRMERLPRLGSPPGEAGSMALRFDPSERGGDQVVVARKVTVAIGDRVLVDGFTGYVARGDVVGFIGPNGAGKSTLLRTLIGEREAASGDLRIGGSIRAAYYRQDLAQVPLERTLYEIISDLRPTWGRGPIQGHLGRFGFSGDEVQRRADTLSGGERARVALAMMMLSGANLLILDEPTNHLDVESIEALEDALEDYEGSVILVSHDRALLRALSTRVWVLHDRMITEFDGTFGEWEAISAERAHAAAVRAAEEEALRRVRERKRTRPPDPRATDARADLRRARQRLEEAETRVEALERQIAGVSAELEDPGLYTRSDGRVRAEKLGRELDILRASLDAAITDWTRETEIVESLAR